ncbi:MAG: ABC transporter permease [Zhaonellaceae bacterium]|nr:ABC transporter permease [Clostridia bacterium]
MNTQFDYKRIETGLSYLISSLLSIAVALIISSFILLGQGKDPLQAFSLIFQGGIGDMAAFGASLVRACPLMLAALGIAFAFKAGIYNIGAEGQIYLGAMFATWVGILPLGLPKIIHLPLAILTGMAAGASWAFIPAYLKVKKGFNEVIMTILLNYIGVYFVNASVHSYLQEPNGYYPQTSKVLETATLPKLMANSELHAGILLGLIGAVILYVILQKTDFGYQLRCVGSNPEASRTSGMNAKLTLIAAMLVSGAFAGLAGASEVLGYQHLLLENFSPNTGYDAISVALLGRLNPIGVVIAAIFIGVLRTGANTMQIMMGVPVTIVYIIQAIIILCVLAFTNWKLDLSRFFERGAKDANSKLANRS